MKLIITPVSSEDEATFTVNGKKHFCDGQSICFSLQNSKCDIFISNLSSPPRRKRYYLLMYFLLLPITFLRICVNMLCQNFNDKWYHEINPYDFSASGELLLENDSVLSFEYKKSCYNDDLQTWDKPLFYINGATISNYKYEFKKNKWSFFDEFFGYFCTMSIMCIINSLFFGVIGWRNWGANQIISILCIVIGSVLNLLIILKIFCEYRRMRMLLNRFINSQD